jgi:aminoglycoside phosphotransferase
MWHIVWIVIPLAAIFAGVAKKWIDLKARQLDTAAKVAGEQAAQYAAKIERLEAHVAVLNRIVTDRSGHLAEEIDALRKPAPLN